MECTNYKEGIEYRRRWIQWRNLLGERLECLHMSSGAAKPGLKGVWLLLSHFIYFYIGTLQKGACKQQLWRLPGTQKNMLLSHFYFFQAQKGACNQYLWRLKTSPPSIKNYKKKANRDHRKTEPNTKKKTREENNCIYSLLRAVYTRDAKSR